MAPFLLSRPLRELLCGRKAVASVVAGSYLLAPVFQLPDSPSALRSVLSLVPGHSLHYGGTLATPGVARPAMLCSCSGWDPGPSPGAQLQKLQGQGEGGQPTPRCRLRLGGSRAARGRRVGSLCPSHPAGTGLFKSRGPRGRFLPPLSPSGWHRSFPLGPSWAHEIAVGLGSGLAGPAWLEGEQASSHMVTFQRRRRPPS